MKKTQLKLIYLYVLMIFTKSDHLFAQNKDKVRIGVHAGILMPKGAFSEGDLDATDVIPYATPGHTYSGNLHLQLRSKFGLLFTVKKQSLEAALPGSAPIEQTWASNSFLAGFYKQISLSDSLQNGLEISAAYGITDSSPPFGVKSSNPCYNIGTMLYFEASPSIQVQFFANYFYSEQSFTYSKQVSIQFPIQIEYNTHKDYDIEFQTLSIGLGLAKFF